MTGTSDPKLWQAAFCREVDMTRGQTSFREGSVARLPAAHRGSHGPAASVGMQGVRIRRGAKREMAESAARSKYDSAAILGADKRAIA